jgi:uncharacterized membrane protein YsdA (DUF1294 family)
MSGRVGIWASLLFLIGLALGAVGGRVPIWLALAYGLMSLVTLLWYGLDKSAAVNNRQRTPERTLHLLALFGGWPGALLGQSILRHKSSKASFQWVFRVTVLVNVAVLAWLLWSRAGRGADRLLIDGWRALGALLAKAGLG